MRKNELATHLGQVPDCTPAQTDSDLLQHKGILSAFINYVAIICKPSLSNSDCSHFKSPTGQGDYMLNRSRNSRSLHLLQLQPLTECKKILGNNWTNTDSVTTNRGISDLSLLDIYDI